MEKWHDYYKIMNLPQEANIATIDEVRDKLLKKYVDDWYMLNMVKEAYSVLTNPKKRKAYDKEWLKKKESGELDKVDEAPSKAEVEEIPIAVQTDAPKVRKDFNKIELAEEEDPYSKNIRMMKKKSARGIWINTILSWIWLFLMVWMCTIRNLSWLLVLNIALVVGYLNLFKNVKKSWIGTGRNVKKLYIMTACVGVAALLIGIFLNDSLAQLLKSWGVTGIA